MSAAGACFDYKPLFGRKQLWKHFGHGTQEGSERALPQGCARLRAEGQLSPPGLPGDSGVQREPPGVTTPGGSWQRRCQAEPREEVSTRWAK